MVLPAIEHSDDGHPLRLIVDGIGDHGAPFVVRKPEAGGSKSRKVKPKAGQGVLF